MAPGYVGNQAWKANHNGCYCVIHGGSPPQTILSVPNDINVTGNRRYALTSEGGGIFQYVTQYDFARCYSSIVEQMNFSTETCICATQENLGTKIFPVFAYSEHVDDLCALVESMKPGFEHSAPYSIRLKVIFDFLSSNQLYVVCDDEPVFMAKVIKKRCLVPDEKERYQFSKFGHCVAVDNLGSCHIVFSQNIHVGAVPKISGALRQKISGMKKGTPERNITKMRGNVL